MSTANEWHSGNVSLYLGDCLEVLATLEAGSVDAIIADLPYVKTQCAWDSAIALEPLWEQYERTIKPQAAVVLFGVQPFTSMLVMSRLEWFKYEIVWRKSRSTGHLNCKMMPLRQHENLLVFGQNRITYNPQIVTKPKRDRRPLRKYKASECYGAYSEDAERTIPQDMSYPRSILDIPSTNHGEIGLHPTQKPVALLEYLV